MTSNLGYFAAVLAIGFVITVSLRAVPFLVLEPLRKSAFVRAMSAWLPVGILGILALATFFSSAGIMEGTGWVQLAAAIAAAAVTVVVHFLARRTTLLSVGLGTLTFVLAVNLL